jgi:hypothetical protein
MMRNLQFFFTAVFFLIFSSVAGAQSSAAAGSKAESTSASKHDGDLEGAATLPDAPAALGSIVGTVTDAYGDIVPGAKVVLDGPRPEDRITVLANDDAFFQIKNVKPGGPYRITVSLDGFAPWTSPEQTLNSGQELIVTGIALKVQGGVTTVNAVVSTEQLATEQIEIEETQRVLGVFPNFYVAYDINAAPLTTKLKFQLAIRSSIDPMTFVGSAFLAGINQAADTPDYVQGAKGFGQRMGATYADGLSDILFGGAILPSLFHQDPRYFYQGTGTHKSRLMHAIDSEFIARGDNGRWQPNYSSIGGDLISGAFSETYYPNSNRGVGLLLNVALTDTAARIANNVVQEFVLRKFTKTGHR